MGKITKKQELMNWANKTVITQDIVPCSPLCRTFIYTYGRQSTYVTHRLRDLYYRHVYRANWQKLISDMNETHTVSKTEKFSIWEKRSGTDFFPLAFFIYFMKDNDFLLDKKS